MRTSRMLQYMNTKVGTPFDQKTFDTDLERFRSWMYFEVVRPTVKQTDDGVLIQIEVKEKWTTIPEVDIKYGGDVFSAKLGVKDTNFLGYRQEAMIYGGWRAMEWLAGARFIEPRILGSLFGVRIEAQRQFYEDPIYTTDKWEDPQYDLVVERLGGQVRFEREVSDLFRVGITASYSLDRNEKAENSKTDDAPDTGFEIPDKSVAAAGGLWIKAGRADFNDYIFSGVTFEADARFYQDALGSRSDFERYEGDFRFYIPVPGKMNATGRVFAGFENSDQFIEQYTLGGLDNLRGFPDRRYRGRATAIVNLEYRWMAFSWWWFSFMFVGLSDTATAWNFSTDDFRLDRDIHSSAGPGHRLIINKWDNAVIRLDLAWPLTESGPPGINFGMDMFF